MLVGYKTMQPSIADSSQNLLANALTSPSILASNVLAIAQTSRSSLAATPKMSESVKICAAKAAVSERVNQVVLTLQMPNAVLDAQVNAPAAMQVDETHGSSYMDDSYLLRQL